MRLKVGRTFKITCEGLLVHACLNFVQSELVFDVENLLAFATITTLLCILAFGRWICTIQNCVFNVSRIFKLAFKCPLYRNFQHPW